MLPPDMAFSSTTRAALHRLAIEAWRMDLRMVICGNNAGLVAGLRRARASPGDGSPPLMFVPAPLLAVPDRERRET
jgi:hypothetical protein